MLRLLRSRAGGVMSTPKLIRGVIKKWAMADYGYAGRGNGYGYSDVYGFGDGDGYGDAYGDGYGDGCGDAYGDACGDGYGDGDGDGHGDGFGYGCVEGRGDGSGTSTTRRLRTQAADCRASSNPDHNESEEDQEKTMTTTKTKTEKTMTTTKTKTETEKTMTAERPVLVTTAHRGVFFGYAENTDGDTITLRGGRLCIYWSRDVRGFMGLAANGPTASCRIGPAATITLRDITAVVEVTEAAVMAWEAAPWS